MSRIHRQKNSLQVLICLKNKTSLLRVASRVGLTHAAAQATLCPELFFLSSRAYVPSHWDVFKQVMVQLTPGVLGRIRKAATLLDSILSG